jgi:hypothetical protein
MAQRGKFRLRFWSTQASVVPGWLASVAVGGLAFGLSPAGCEKRQSATDAAGEPMGAKVEFEILSLDSAGLSGPEGGKVQLSYEFAIPDEERCRTEVLAIDPSVRFMSGSRGRIGARKGECLCIGSTGPESRRALAALCKLPYVRRIIRCDFE